MSFNDIHPNFKFRISIQFITTIATNAVIPFLAIFFSEKVNPIFAGILVSVMVVASLIGGLIGGVLADEIGRKKLMIAAEILVAITYLIVFMTIQFELMWVTFVLLVLNSFFSGSFLPAAQSMTIDIMTNENKKTIFTISYWVSNLGFAIGTTIGILFFRKYVDILFISLFIVSVLSIFATIFLITDTYTPPSRTESQKQSSSAILKSFLSKYSSIVKDQMFRLYFLSIVFLVSLENQLANYIGVRLETEGEKHIDIFNQTFSFSGLELIGVLRTENTLIVVFLGAIIAIIIKNMKDKSQLIVGTTLYTVGYTILGFSSIPLLLMLAMMIATLGEILFVPIRQSILADIIPEKARGSYIASNQLAFKIAQMSGGLFLTIGMYTNKFIISGLYAVLGLIAILLILTVINKKNSFQEKKVS
ncbi:MFS transporter [Bacillus cereus]|uniref:MFS transporter n=1 Tax=Bacillus cereus TaxID=1396 RepID=A0A9X8IVT1_BACCE|nr:MFS transporter [Bacillus cereus]RWQ71099.1 MFS transporter [Bacillus cereus]